VEKSANMQQTTGRYAFFQIFLVSLLLLATFISSEAHVVKIIDKYKIELGWLNEPAYVEDLNAVVLYIEDSETGEPVAGVADTLKVEIIYGGKSIMLNLVPSLKEEGLYYAEFIPTRRGTYTFRIFGKINGVPIDEKFELENVISKVDLQFPESLPTTAELAEELTSMRESIDRALLIGAGGLIAGVLGIIVGIITLRRRSTHTNEE